jgi:hypothetical protein
LSKDIGAHIEAVWLLRFTLISMDPRVLKNTANLTSYRAWSQLCLKRSGLQAYLIYLVVASGFGPMAVSFARLGVGQDARRFVHLLLLIVVSSLALTLGPATFFLVRFIRYQRRHPWTPPDPEQPAAGASRRRLDRMPRALEI